MKTLIFTGLFLAALHVLGQGDKDKKEKVEERLLGSWKYQVVQAKSEVDKLNKWGIDTVELRSDATLTFYVRQITNSKVIQYDKLIGTWELKSDLKTLIVTIRDETVEMPFRFRGEALIQIKHPVKITQDTTTTDNPNIKMGFTIVSVTYRKLGTKNYTQQKL